MIKYALLFSLQLLVFALNHASDYNETNKENYSTNFQSSITESKQKQTGNDVCEHKIVVDGNLVRYAYESLYAEYFKDKGDIDCFKYYEEKLVKNIASWLKKIKPNIDNKSFSKGLHATFNRFFYNPLQITNNFDKKLITTSYLYALLEAIDLVDYQREVFGQENEKKRLRCMTREIKALGGFTIDSTSLKQVLNNDVCSKKSRSITVTCGR